MTTPANTETESKTRFEDLAAPFDDSEIEWRVSRAWADNTDGKKFHAKVVPYVSNRAIQQRLDDVFGPDGWQNEYRSGPDGGVLCGLSLLVNPDATQGRWLTKWDGAPNTGIESVKGGLSDAMKRAAVQWGIGRYLYKVPEAKVVSTKNGRLTGVFKDRKKNNHYFTYNPPVLAKLMAPKAEKRERPENVITDEQATALKGLAIEAKIGSGPLLRRLGVTRWGDITQDQYETITKELKAPQ